MANTLPAPSTSPPEVQTSNTWIKASWSEFLVAADALNADQSQFYYDNGCMRIETMPVGSGHSQDNTLLSQVVSLYGTLKNIRIKGFTNGSFRKQGMQECQPDMAFYVGDGFQIPPKDTDPIDVNVWGAPNLVIEIASTTLNDDLGRKRLLYERLGVQEYWVVDVAAAEVIAFAVRDGGSRQIQMSGILAGLDLAIVQEALQRNQTEEDGAINRWLLQIFAEPPSVSLP